jgi:glucose-1-phosphate cytidylyltransferase
VFEQQEGNSIKVVLLAGGRGTRMAPLTTFIPKPMIEVGGTLILVHIMRHYAKFGFKDFTVALGFRGEIIKRYIVDHCSLGGHVKVDFKSGQVLSSENTDVDWQVDLVDTGIDAQTGSRLRKLAHYVGDRFMLTYGDGLTDVDITALVAFHRQHGKLATLTAVRPLARFGHLDLDGDLVSQFSEKSQVGVGWINGGYFVFEREVLDMIPDGDGVSLELDILSRLAEKQQLMAYRHDSFWQCMDTERDRDVLETIWTSGNAPWAG